MKDNPYVKQASDLAEDFDENVISEEGITDATIVATALQIVALSNLAVAHEIHAASAKEGWKPFL